MKYLAVWMKPYRKECALGPLFKLLEALLELIVPLIIARLVDQAIPSGARGSVLICGLELLLLAAVGLAASVTAQYYAARAAIGFSTALRKALFQHIHTLSYSNLDDLGASTMITRLTSDINQVQTGVNLGLRLLLRSPFVVFGAMIMAFTIDSRLALIFAGVIAVLFLIVFGIVLGAMPLQKKVRQATDEVSTVTRENLAGIRVIRAFRREEAETERFDRLSRFLAEAQLRAGRLTAALNPLTCVALNLAIVLLLHQGAFRVDSGSLTQGQMIALYNYMAQILVELVKLANLIVTLTKSAACAGRVSEMLQVSARQQEGDQTFDARSFRELSFRDVSIAYHASGDAALEHLSFTASAGQTVGIIGGTGSGKTTLVNLIPRFYDRTGGEIMMDQTPIEKFTLSSLRGAVGVVPQHASLFAGTIRSNLLWGNPDASDEDLWQALRTAQGEEFVREKAGGLEEKVLEGGRNFSGGQRQRLTIARALVRKPAILILDDSASALDFATDAALRKAMRQIQDPPLTFIVSQRTASVRFADLILVLEDGVCVGKGTHDQLMETCPVYREIHEASAGKEETGHA